MIAKIKYSVVSAMLMFAAFPSFAGSPGQLKWTGSGTGTTTTGGPVTGSPAISTDGSTVYITSEDGFLYALSTSSGTTPIGQHWPAQVNSGPSYDPEFLSSPVVATNGTIYVASTDGNLYDINPDGSQNWVLLLNPGGNRFVGAVAVGFDGTVYVTYDDVNQLFAVNPTGNNGKGEIQWTFDISQQGLGSFIDSPPAVGPDGTIYFWGGGQLIAVDCGGNFKWALPLQFGEDTDDFQYTPVVDTDGTIYVPFGCNNADSLIAINPDGTPKHSLIDTFTGTPIESSPAIGGQGTIYFGASDGTLYAVNKNGSLKWTFNTGTGQPINSSPAIAADGSIYFGSNSSNLWCIQDNGTNASLNWTYPPGGQLLNGVVISSPAIGANSTVYFGCGDNNVYAVYNSAPLTNSSWPMFRRNLIHTASQGTTCCPEVVSVSLGGPSYIYKGYTGFGIPYGGYTWFNLTRPYPGPSLFVTFLLGGDGTSFQDSNPYFATYPLDFTPTGCHSAPFPNGFFLTFPSGQTQMTVGVQTVNGNHVSDEQILLCTIPTQSCVITNPNAFQTNAWILDNNVNQ